MFTLFDVDDNNDKKYHVIYESHVLLITDSLAKAKEFIKCSEYECILEGQ